MYPCRSNSERRTLLGLALVLSLLTFISFSPVLWCDFIDFDDAVYVLQNRDVLQGLSWNTIHHALSTTLLGLWHPLSVISFTLDHEVFGKSPVGYHLENLLIHIMNGLLLLLLLWRLSNSLWRSAAVAILFAIHPLRVESVAWIAERKDLLSAMFFLLALVAYERYVRCRSTWAYLLVLPLLLLSLMAKPMFVTLPFVLLLLDFWPLRRFEGTERIPGANQSIGTARFIWLIVEKLPFLAVSLCVSWYVMRAPTLVAESAPVSQGPAAVSVYVHHPFSLRLANGGISYLRYLRKMVWFPDLAFFYPMPESWPMWQAVGAVLLLTLVTVGALLLARRCPHLPVGWFWYLGVLFPALGVATQICEYSLADRYTYAASIGVLILLFWSIPDRLWNSQRSRRWSIAAFGAILPLLGVSTWMQTSHWQTSISLFEHAANVSTDNWLAHLNLGSALGEKGRHEEAISHLRRTIAIRPRLAMAYYDLGLELRDTGRIDAAIEAFQEALHLDPGNMDCVVAWGKTLSDLHRHDEALGMFRHAIETANPPKASAYIGLALELADHGELDEALTCYQNGIRVLPDDPLLRVNMAGLLLRQGHPEEAIAHCDKALAVAPDLAGAHMALAIALIRMNRKEAALEHLEAAYAADPNNPDVQAMLAGSFPRQGGSATPLVPTGDKP